MLHFPILDTAMQPVGLTILVAIAAIMNGCANYRPRPLDPRAEVARLRGSDLQRFVTERAEAAEVSGVANMHFDPSDGLDDAEVVAVALTLNPELREKRAEVGEARAALITAGLWPNPEAGMSVRPGIDGASSYALEADALFQLLRPGERDARKKVASAGLEEVQAEVVAEEFRLVAEVRRQRIAVLAAERVVALLKDALDLRQRANDLVQRQRQLGDATELATSASQLELAETRREVRQAETELQAESRKLKQLIGLPPEYDLKLTGFGQPLAVGDFGDVSDEELDRRLVEGRPELRAQEAAYRGAEEQLRLAVLQQYPRLGLGPAFERELEGEQSLGLGLSLELPLLNQNQGEIAERRAARERARMQYTALLHRLRADAFAARAVARAARAEVETQEKDVVPLLRRNQELFEAAYKAGELNIIDWITAQQRAVNARREYIDAVARYRAATIDLEAATGRPAAVPTTAPATRPSQNN